MDSGDYGVAGPGAFRYGQRFLGGTHLTDADHIRVLAQDALKQKILVDVKGRVFVGPGQQVDYAVYCMALCVPLDEVKFPAALLDGDEAAVVRYHGEEPAHHRGLSGTGTACDTNGYAVTDAAG